MSTQKKNVLGRGLSALIPKVVTREVSVNEGETAPEQVAEGSIARIACDRILPNPFQPRSDFDRTALDELKQSIIEKGVIQPVTVRRFGEQYQLVTGERRLRAAQAAGLTHIPAYVLDVQTDAEMLELAIIENVQREHLNPMEVAAAYQRLISECRLTQEEVSQKVGKDRTTVTNFLRLLKLPLQIQEGLRSNKLTMGHARALINIPSESLQLKLYEKIVHDGLSVRKVELYSKDGKPRAKSSAKGAITVSSSSVRSVEEKIRQALATKVTVRPKGGGRGEIVIEYYSLDDLDRLLDLFAAVEKYH
ncbi:MAG: ParB/RepB/Spo0J family partition protein [Ignavibacteriae bacterium]|nr:ParB/RepB/Spo0J family partition protein [Ignavibacteriota bacterium]